jgi:hypothetical protein
MEGGRLAGIVSLDDIAVRMSILEVARQMSAGLSEGALPEFYLQERG